MCKTRSVRATICVFVVVCWFNWPPSLNPASNPIIHLYLSDWGPFFESILTNRNPMCTLIILSFLFFISYIDFCHFSLAQSRASPWNVFEQSDHIPTIITWQIQDVQKHGRRVNGKTNDPVNTFVFSRPEAHWGLLTARVWRRAARKTPRQK